MIVLDYRMSRIHISETTRQAEISYAVFCWKKKKKNTKPSILLHVLTTCQESMCELCWLKENTYWGYR